ncbi:MAG: serpin family protein [Clostridia bacterium]|nr:serpin family protein [Clostridia bacterium]
MKRSLTALISAILLLSIALNLSSCATRISAEDMMEGVSPRAVENAPDVSQLSAEISDFALRLYSASGEEDGNKAISPISVLFALAMTANGADKETRAEMEEVFGVSIDSLNLYLYSYMNSLPSAEKYKLSLANSIWVNGNARFTVNEDFLQKNADYYGADIYRAPFDRSTLNDINNWIKKETEGLIPKVLDDIPKDVIMYLVNALYFDAEWNKIYENTEVRDGDFHKADGSETRAEFMYSDEGGYIENGNMTGFTKLYKGGKYAFVAMLPNEGTSPEELIASLSGEELSELLSKRGGYPVKAAIPKFEYGYSAELSDALKKMGMPSAFDLYSADFSRLGTLEGADADERNIVISRVLHKTFISVGEKGTRAGAATVVEMLDGAADNIEEPKRVYLDRPFAFMLIDTKSNIPFFIGTVNEV